MTGPTGLRRFVQPPATPAAVAAPSDPAQPASRPSPAQPASRPPPAQQEPERCELCATEVSAEHGHIADLEAASLLCACRACYLLFTQRGAGLRDPAADRSGPVRGRYLAVPDRYLHDPERAMSPREFDELEIPVGLAFFLRTSRDGGRLTGFYPSPAGVTECELDLTRWQRLVADYPLLGVPAEDVEAALVSRTDDGVEYYLVPIDACYELAGRMRLNWRGFDGGTEARDSISAFLATVRQRARPVGTGEHDG